jgi:uncharacterized protein (DUF58 family)
MNKIRKTPKKRQSEFLWLWKFRLTPPGRFLLAALFLSASMSWISTGVPIFHLTCGLFGLFTVAVAAGFLLRPRIEVTGQFPPKAKAGQCVTGVFVLTNRSRLPACQVSAGYFDLPPSLQEIPADEIHPYVPRGESVSAPVEIRPLKRGYYLLPPLKPYTTFPFHIWRTRARAAVSPGTLLVLPDFQPLDGLDVPGRIRYQPGGIALTSQVGESPEYVGNRNYRPGDPMRRIDFRSWGRLARPVIREFQEEYYCRIALVLDTFIPPGRKEKAEGFPDLEAAVSLAASIADTLSRGEYIMDVFAAGPELYVFRAGRHTAHLENVLEILACVGACRKNPFETVAPALAEELHNISGVVCVLLDWDKSRERLIRTAAEAGCNIKVLIVCAGETTEPLAGAAPYADSVIQFTPEEVQGGGLGVL